MLRITRTEKADGEIHLIVEGRLVGAWVSELQTAVLAADPESTRLHLDLSDVKFVDKRGTCITSSAVKTGRGISGSFAICPGAGEHKPGRVRCAYH